MFVIFKQAASMA